MQRWVPEDSHRLIYRSKAVELFDREQLVSRSMSASNFRGLFHPSSLPIFPS
jgi:hypothetical protein